jgi:hypothetical protein
MIRVQLTIQTTVKVKLVTNLQCVIDSHNDQLQRLQDQNPRYNLISRRLLPYHGCDECDHCARYNTFSKAVAVSEADDKFCLECANVETHINYMEDEYGSPLGQCPECKKLHSWDERSGFRCWICGYQNSMWSICI